MRPSKESRMWRHGEGCTITVVSNLTITVVFPALTKQTFH